MMTLKKIIDSLTGLRRPNKNEKPLNIIHSHFHDLPSDKYKTVFNDIYNGNVDAVIIHDFISEKEKEFLIESIKTEEFPTIKDVKYMFDKNIGYTLGKTIIDTKNLDDYKNSAEIISKNEQQIFGFDYTSRITSLLSKLSDKHIITTPKFGDKEHYLTSSIRVFKIFNNCIQPHSDLLIHLDREETRDLMKLIKQQTILSFYVVIQKPEKGGSLRIFDKRVNDTPESTLSYFKNTPKKFIDTIGSYPSTTIDPPERSLILFDAGQRWHQVDSIAGNLDRITMGSFLGYSSDMKQILFWS